MTFASRRRIQIAFDPPPAPSVKQAPWGPFLSDGGLYIKVPQAIQASVYSVNSLQCYNRLIVSHESWQVFFSLLFLKLCTICYIGSLHELRSSDWVQSILSFLKQNLFEHILFKVLYYRKVLRPQDHLRGLIT